MIANNSYSGGEHAQDGEVCTASNPDNGFGGAEVLFLYSKFVEKSWACTGDGGASVCYSYGLDCPEVAGMLGGNIMELRPVFQLRFYDNMQVCGVLVSTSFQPLATLLAKLEAL